MDLLYLDPSAPDYPARLRDIPDPPDRLWVRGDPRALARTSVAIVGSRRASPGSLDIAHRLASDLARIGLTIVSGLARGCDGAAHRGALDAGGTTIAVLGSGPDVIYPPEHDALAEQIARQGRDSQRVSPRRPAAAQSLPAAQSPHQRARPRRDRHRGQRQERLADHRRLRAGAGTRSHGRPRHRARRPQPGRPSTHPRRRRAGGERRGCAGGARERRPRHPRERSERVPRSRRRRAALGADGAEPPEDPVLAALDPDDPQDFDQLARRTGLPATPLLARLAELELSCQIARYPGGRFVRCSGKVIT